MNTEMISLASFVLFLARCCVIQGYDSPRGINLLRDPKWNNIFVDDDLSIFDSRGDYMKPYRRNSDATIYKEDIVQPTEKHTGTLFFLHGKGMTGRLMKETIENITDQSTFPHLKIIYPTAPASCWQQGIDKATLLNVWLHNGKNNPELDDIDSEDQIKWIDNKCTKYLHQFIQREYFSGIPLKRIIVGGYQSGGAMSMHLGFRILPHIGGVFSLHSYLYNKSTVYKHLDTKRPKKLPHLFFYASDNDTVTPFAWAKITATELKKRNVTGYYEGVWNQNEEIDKRELFRLWLWIERVVPREYDLTF